MKDGLLEISENTGEGYKPLVHFGSWRVAVAASAERFTRDGISYLEYHAETDEVFVLLEGEAYLITPDCEAFSDCNTVKTTSKFTYTKLLKNKVYNVKKGVWHVIEISGDSTVLIVENDDTCADNSKYYYLNEEEKTKIKTHLP